jgi:hypothetical protein
MIDLWLGLLFIGVATTIYGLFLMRAEARREID